MQYLAQLLACVFLLPRAWCLSSGPPSAACSKMEPLGHTGAGQTPTDLGFSISVDSDVINGGNNKVLITVSGSESFKGIFIQVRDASGNIRGIFDSAPTGFKLLNCFDKTASAFGHANNALKGKTVSVTWLAPASCTGDYTVRASVVTEYSRYQTGIKKTLICAPPLPPTPSSPRTTSPQLPTSYPTPLPTKSASSSSPSSPSVTAGFSITTDIPGSAPIRRCQHADKTVIPAKYNSSFEDGLYHGWHNSGWRRNKGTTRTWNTGPSQAEDGNYYLYHETSWPRTSGDQAVLDTSEDLSGCFCVHIACNHNVYNVYKPDVNKHKISILVGGNVVWERVKRMMIWSDVYVQVDVENNTKISVVGTRGDTFMGDTAIDNLYIYPGLCPVTSDL